MSNERSIPLYRPDLEKYVGMGGEGGAIASTVIDWSEGMRGWSRVLNAPINNLPSGLEPYNPNHSVNTQVYSLLDTDLRRYMPGGYVDGSYQLALTTKLLPIQGEDVDIVIAPVVFVVQFGSGGSQHEVEVDGEQVITIPSDQIRVGIKWDTLQSAPNTIDGQTVRVPAVECFATVIRAGQSATNRATRSKYIYLDVGENTNTFDIPYFASGFAIYADAAQRELFATAPYQTGILPNENNVNSVVDEIDGSQMRRMSRDQCSRSLPRIAQSMSVGRGADGVVGSFIVEFQLAFGAGD